MLTAKRVEREKRHGQISRRPYPWLVSADRSHRRQELAIAIRARRPRALARAGALDVVDLKTARERARAARLLLLDGVDPIDHKQGREGQAGRRQGQAADLSRGRAGVLRSARRQVEERQARQPSPRPRCGSMRTRCSATWRWPKSACRKYCARSSRIGTPKPKPCPGCAAGSKAVLDWCTVRGYRTGDNPARWKGHLSEVLPARGQIKKTNHHPALPYRDIPAFMADLRKREGVAVRALEFANPHRRTHWRGDWRALG